MLLTGSCGSSETPRWQGLKSVHVTVSRPGLSPPGGKPSTTSFLPGHGVQRAQNALYRYGIAPPAQPRTNTGCAGGYVSPALQNSTRADRLHLPSL
jgi:hypothetical protein